MPRSQEMPRPKAMAARLGCDHGQFRSGRSAVSAILSRLPRNQWAITVLASFRAVLMSFMVISGNGTPQGIYSPAP